MLRVLAAEFYFLFVNFLIILSFYTKVFPLYFSWMSEPHFTNNFQEISVQ
jgi:hypothetical protein